MRLAVDPTCEPADDDEAGPGKLAAEQARNLRAVRRAGARTDDRDRAPGQQLAFTAAANEEPGRRVVELTQPLRIRRIATPYETHAQYVERGMEACFVEPLPEAVELTPARRLDEMPAGLCREGR